jgi:hypothetical protein
MILRTSSRPREGSGARSIRGKLGRISSGCPRPLAGDEFSGRQLSAGTAGFFANFPTPTIGRSIFVGRPLCSELQFGLERRESLLTSRSSVHRIGDGSTVRFARRIGREEFVARASKFNQPLN